MSWPRQTEARTYTIEGPPSLLNRIENFLLLAQFNASVGHSAKIGIPIDGDGVDNPLTVVGGNIDFNKRTVARSQLNIETSKGYVVELAYDNSFGGLSKKDVCGA